MKGQLTRDENGDLWMYIAPHHTGYWKFVDADDNWVDRGMALQVTGDAAALFEAAPELLAALKAHLPFGTEEPPQGWGFWKDAIDAINKAEGQGG